MSTMTSKTRVLRSLEHKEVDRIPTFYLGGGGVNGKLAQRLGIATTIEEDLLRALDVDVRFLVPRFIDGTGHCNFQYGGVHAILQKEKGYESIVMQKLPLEEMRTVDEILAYERWPNPDWYDYRIPAPYAKRIADRAVVAYDMGIIFLFAMGLRGMEQIMVDMIESPDIAHAIFGRITDLHCERIRRFVAANDGFIDIVGIGDDVAGQSGLFFGIDMWREFLKPYVKKMADLCHALEVIPYFHGCGGFRDLYDDFLEMGIRTTGRLQTEAKGNDFAELKRLYGKELSFWGAVDGQHVCIEGTPDDVRAHVRSLIAANTDNTGFIAGPTHSFTPDTPIENIIAVYEALRGKGKRKQ